MVQRNSGTMRLVTYGVGLGGECLRSPGERKWNTNTHTNKIHTLVPRTDFGHGGSVPPGTKKVYQV